MCFHWYQLIQSPSLSIGHHMYVNLGRTSAATASLKVDLDIFIQGRPPKKKKSKLRDFVPFSISPSPPTIKRDILKQGHFSFFPPPSLPHRNRDISAKKKFFPSTFLVNLKGTKIGVKIIFHPSHPNLNVRTLSQSPCCYLIYIFFV